MARAHGRYSQLYVAITSGGAATPLSHAGTWEMNLETDQVEVTAFGDTTRTYVAGLPNGTLTFSGFASDTASTSLVTATLDGVARKFYAYPFSSSSIYFWGTGYLSVTTGTDINGAVTISGTITPATSVAAQGF